LCQAFPKLSTLKKREQIIAKLKEDKDMRIEVCKEHMIVRYVLDGLGFEFPEDEQITHIANPEINQTWNLYEQ